MRLEMAEYPVRELRLGSRHRYDDGILVVDGDDLARRALEDPRIESARVDVVRPGQPVRVTGIRDVVEPRIKFGAAAQVFPGVLGPVAAVGGGLTHRLSGMAVLATAAYEGTVRAGTGVQRSAILDMWGPGAEASRFSALNHLVLVLKIKDGLGELEAHSAVQRAEFETARRVAATTEGLAPARAESFDPSDHAAARPRVVLIQGCITQAQQPHSGIAYYGMPIRESLPTVIHPNELLDGAVTVNTTRGIGYYPTTWDWQNHPLAMGLYREHAKERLSFAGVILERISYETHHAKEAVAHNAAQLAQTLGADAALSTWTGSGNAFVEVMLTIRACERLGIRTALVTYEYGGKDGVDAPLLFYAAEADAVVSTGSRDRWIELPAPERIVGAYDALRVLSYPGAPTTPARSALTLDARDLIIGGVDNWGRGTWTCQAF